MLSSNFPNIIFPKDVPSEKAEENFNNLLAITNANSPSSTHLVWLGYCYQLGIGTKVDNEKAYRCYRKAVELYKYDASAWNNLGLCYLYGEGVALDQEKAFLCLENANEVDKNASEPWINLGYCYLMGFGTQRNPQQAFHCLNTAITLNENSYNAWRHLTVCYAEGLGTNINMRQALICAQKAVELANRHAPQVTNPAVTNAALLFSTTKPSGNSEQLPSQTINSMPISLEAQIKIKEEEIKLLQEQLALSLKLAETNQENIKFRKLG